MVSTKSNKQEWRKVKRVPNGTQCIKSSRALQGAECLPRTFFAVVTSTRPNNVTKRHKNSQVISSTSLTTRNMCHVDEERFHQSRRSKVQVTLNVHNPSPLKWWKSLARLMISLRTVFAKSFNDLVMGSGMELCCYLCSSEANDFPKWVSFWLIFVHSAKFAWGLTTNLSHYFDSSIVHPAIYPQHYTTYLHMNPF